MDTGKSLQGEALALLGRLKDKKEAVEAECKQRLQEIDREIDAVSTTLRLLGEPGAGASRPIDAPTGSRVAISTLIGKKARQALIEIARQNDGRVRIVDAKELLLSAGILRPTKNVWGAIYTTLQRSKEFQKVEGEPGTFRLIDPEQPALPIQ